MKTVTTRITGRAPRTGPLHMAMVFGLMLVMAFAWTPLASAQMLAQASQQMVIPQNQGGAAGSTLELPTTPQQPGASLNIPSQVQQPQQGQELELPTRELRDQPGYAQVTVTVTDPRGSYLTGLKKDDFKLQLDGHLQPIQFFRQDTNTPVSIGIVVDTSGSMQPKIPQARIAIAQFLRDLNDRDDVFLFAFSDRPYLLQPFTMNHSLVMEKLRLLNANGETALFDTIMRALQMVEHGRYDKKALLVVTDGMDNQSRETVEGVVGEARRLGVLIYSIGIGDPNATAGLGSIAIGPLVFGGGDVERVDAATLTTLSKETGARTYIIHQVGDGAQLRAACEQISLELREQYTIGFVAPDASAGGYRSVHVDVPTHADAAVRVRKGVEVGGARAYASGPDAP
ncbi:MAG TPA: VWA domain-containing protein [Candidatus Binataceae bacterium]|nr:VWA domain-containing protein [Candidatus Binataceae bacterium]